MTLSAWIKEYCSGSALGVWVRVELVILLHCAGCDNYMQKATADVAKLGNVVSTERGWIMAQEELNVCDD